MLLSIRNSYNDTRSQLGSLWKTFKSGFLVNFSSLVYAAREKFYYSFKKKFTNENFPLNKNWIIDTVCTLSIKYAVPVELKSSNMVNSLLLTPASHKQMRTLILHEKAILFYVPLKG